MFSIFLIYSATFGLSWIITDSYLFEATRQWFANKADLHITSTYWDMADYLVNCIICMSLWASFIFLAYSTMVGLVELKIFPLLWFSSPLFVIIVNKLIAYFDTDE